LTKLESVTTPSLDCRMTESPPKPSSASAQRSRLTAAAAKAPGLPSLRDL
jgi:hypothetical protein